ncbi:hypothetical protein S9a_00041 [Klebsiella phage S9a]|nr:hypothetical protein S9a_00041 [Klebsiella phage S9a]
MNDLHAIRLMARIAALQAEVEAMKAANFERQINGEALSYDADAFFYIGCQLNAISDEAVQAGHNA